MLLFVCGLLLLSLCSLVASDKPELKHKVIEVAKIKQRIDVQLLHQTPRDHLHEVIFSVKQQNLDQLDSVLMDVSDPQSPNYGNHWTVDQLRDFTIHPQTRENLKNGLTSFHSSIQITHETIHGEFIFATAPVSVWEEFFNCQFYNFQVQQHSKNAAETLVVVRTMEYSLPSHFLELTEAVFNTVQFPERGVRSHRIQRIPNPAIDPQEKTESVTTSSHLRSSESATKVKPTARDIIPGAVTPALINKVYNVETNKGSSSVSQGVYESKNDALNPDDLTYFQYYFGLPPDEIANKIGGHVSTSACANHGELCRESNLDVQYLMGIAQKVPTTYYYSANDKQNWLLTWILKVADLKTPVDVWSISYSGAEEHIELSIIRQFDITAKKLGINGVTIVVAAGDDGAIDPAVIGQPQKCGYYPGFPAASPYVTTVGATQGPEVDLEEMACQAGLAPGDSLITSGGGFSNVYSTPSWQQKVVKEYFDKVRGTPLEPLVNTSQSTDDNQYYYTSYAASSSIGMFNASGRGYPDVSLMGHNYAVAIDGVMTFGTDGTSASTPVMAAFVSLANVARKAKGKTVMGWLNPFLYQKYKEFTHDIIEGKNNCTGVSETTPREITCCMEGYSGTEGWDPISGLGSIDHKKFVESAMLVKETSSTTTKTKTKKKKSTFKIIFLVAVIILALVIVVIFYCACKQQQNSAKNGQVYAED
jgi:subtilase family serine protease